MISNSFDALAHLFFNNTAVTSQLGFFIDIPNNGYTAIPLIVGGEIAEQEDGLPCIEYYPENGDPILYLRDQKFLVNCYGRNTRESYLLSQTLIEEFNDAQYIADGYPIRLNCNTLITVVDPGTKQVNTPVEFRVVHIKQ